MDIVDLTKTNTIVKLNNIYIYLHEVDVLEHMIMVT